MKAAGFDFLAASRPAAATLLRDFALASDTCTGAVLNPGQFCGFEVVFTPTNDGVRTAEILIDADLFAKPFTIDVVGGDTLFSDGFDGVETD